MKLDWLLEEQRRYHGITDDKIKEFSANIQDNIHWIANYVEDLLKGNAKTDVSDLLKTPSARKQQHKQQLPLAAGESTHYNVGHWDGKIVDSKGPASIAPALDRNKIQEQAQSTKMDQAQVDLAEYMKQVRQKIQKAQKPGSIVERSVSKAIDKFPLSSSRDSAMMELNTDYENTFPKPVISPKRQPLDRFSDEKSPKKPRMLADTQPSAPSDGTSSISRSAIQDHSFMSVDASMRGGLSVKAMDTKIKEQEERLKIIFNGGHERIRKTLEASKSTLGERTFASRETASLANASFAASVSEVSHEHVYVPSLAAASSLPIDSKKLDTKSIAAAKSNETNVPEVEILIETRKEKSSAARPDPTTVSRLPIPESRSGSPASQSLKQTKPNETLKAQTATVPETKKTVVVSDKVKMAEGRVNAAISKKQEEDQKRKELLKRKEEEKIKKLEEIQEQKRKEEEAIKRKRLEKQERVLQNQRLLKQKEEERVRQLEAQMQTKLKAAENSQEQQKPAIPAPIQKQQQQQSSTISSQTNAAKKPSELPVAVKPAGMFAHTILPKPVNQSPKPCPLRPIEAQQSADTSSSSDKQRDLSIVSGPLSASPCPKNSHNQHQNPSDVTPKKMQTNHNTVIAHPSPEVIDPTRTILNKYGDDYVIPAIPSDDETSDEDEENSNNKETFLIPNWAKSPQLRQALYAQKSIDASLIFGEVDPLRLEDIFKGSNLKRYRNRTSSADWSRDNW